MKGATTRQATRTHRPVGPTVTSWMPGAAAASLRSYRTGCWCSHFGCRRLGTDPVSVTNSCVSLRPQHLGFCSGVSVFRAGLAGAKWHRPRCRPVTSRRGLRFLQLLLQVTRPLRLLRNLPTGNIRLGAMRLAFNKVVAKRLGMASDERLAADGLKTLQVSSSEGMAQCICRTLYEIPQIVDVLVA
jgi:hypothetical protein